jgi:hypothetical protein
VKSLELVPWLVKENTGEPLQCEFMALQKLDRLASQEVMFSVVRKTPVILLQLKVIEGHRLSSVHFPANNTTWDALQHLYSTARNPLLVLHDQGIVHGNAHIENFLLRETSRGFEGEWVNFDFARHGIHEFRANLIRDALFSTSRSGNC